MDRVSTKIIALIMAVVIIATAFAACSKSVKTLDEDVDVIEDIDDKIDVNLLLDDESDTFELTDRDGNVLTLAPIYGCDGTTMIAAYIMSVADADGNELDQSAYPNLNAVILVDFEEDAYSLRYNNDELIVVKSYSDDDGFIIALQDVMDYDEDGDIEEFFKVSTKLDSTSHIFIKLDSLDNATPINVQVEEKEDGTATVTDSEGNSVSATLTQKAKSIKEAIEKDKEEKKEQENGGSSESEEPSEEPDTPSEDPNADYTVIVLTSGGEIMEPKPSNVTVEGSIADGGTEVHISGAGDNGKYYITSDVDTFGGQIVLELGVDEDVELKFYNVNINTQKKTAIKLVNADAVKDKENDTEESGTGLEQTGTAYSAVAPKVELSFTGSNSFRANGSGKNGTIYSECKLGIKGHGTATISGGENLSGICCTESITIKNSTLNITSKAKQGISCDKKVLINSGATIEIESKGDGIHCNKFELDGVDADGASADSVLTISSIYSADCADGIDADNQIIIDGGTLNVNATSTGKYALKVRKVLKGSANGYFEINGGVVTASGGLNTTPTSCGQATVCVTSSSATEITVGNYTSASGSAAFICSPTDAASVSNASASANVSWSGNVGTAQL